MISVASGGVRHLGLSPRHLALRDRQMQLLDFGLAELLWLPAGLKPGPLNPRYSPLELFDGGGSDSSDQYSLALIFQELLVGSHPFRNLNQRQMATPRSRGLPDVGLAPAPDRPVLLRALHEGPEQRFASCTELIDALEGASGADQPGEVGPVADLSCLAPGASQSEASWQPAVGELFHAAGRGYTVRSCGTAHYLERLSERAQLALLGAPDAGDGHAQARWLPGTLSGGNPFELGRLLRLHDADNG